MYRICVWKICAWSFGIELFGLVVVLDGRKICIEKCWVLGEMLSKNFQNPRFCLSHHSSKLSDSNLWVN